MQPHENESSAAFVLRVEVERRRWDMEKSATYHAFVKRYLDLPLRKCLDQVRMAKKAAGNNKFSWDDVVTVCRDRQAGIGLAEEEEVEKQKPK